MKYFGFSIFFLLAGVAFAYFKLGGLNAAYIVFLLALLEVSISFDNAVVNAKVLKDMDETWRNRFIVFGIPIAVFGVRFVLPILIVSIASGVGFGEIVNLAIYDGEGYKKMLEGVMSDIYAFGGAFLMMVFLEFYFDDNREIKWLSIIEHNPIVNSLGKINSIEIIIAIGVGIFLTTVTHNYEIAVSYFVGIFCYSLLKSLDDFLAVDGVKSGLMGFLYLEVLDASFSLDGVIGAFALSSDIFVIMLGLGIGAFFVRSLTIYFVEKNMLSEFKFLEHGAHYAIFVLSVIMFLEIFFHISEVITGSVGMAIIVASVVHSIYHKE